MWSVRIRPIESEKGISLGARVAYLDNLSAAEDLAEILNTDFVRLTEDGANRILMGKAGMIFKVDSWTTRSDKKRICHVIDYRFPNGSDAGFQVWTLGVDGFEEL
jgi:hypothetical protein